MEPMTPSPVMKPLPSGEQPPLFRLAMMPAPLSPEYLTRPRDQILQRIEQVGRADWKQESGYHRRSLAETTMFRLKVTFGGRVRLRSFDNQAVELFLQCVALNPMIQVAKPDRYPVEA